jgi:hypothetical protein
MLPLDRATDTLGYLHASLLSVNAWVALALGAAGAIPEKQDRRDRSRVESLEHAEAAAGIQIGGVLRAHFALVDDVFNFLNGVLGAAPELPLREVSLARHVATGLLVRIANDLRCVTMSALSGYPLQAAALVATMYEVACAAVCIDSDDSLARTWSEHKDPTQLPSPFNDVPGMTLAAHRLLKVPPDRLEEAVDAAYMAYRQLCMAKHANPLVQSEHGFEKLESELAAVIGPLAGPQVEVVTAFALEKAAACAVWALASYIEHHVAIDKRPQLEPKLMILAQRRHELHEFMVERGMDKDPAPNLWRLPSQRRKQTT